MLSQYYEIFVYDNELAIVEKIDEDIYNYFKDTFDYVYHTKSEDAYPLHKNFDAGSDMLIVDDKHLYQLLDDLREQGFCETVKLSFIDDYFNDDYNQFSQAF